MRPPKKYRRFVRYWFRFYDRNRTSYCDPVFAGMIPGPQFVSFRIHDRISGLFSPPPIGNS